MLTSYLTTPYQPQKLFHAGLHDRICTENQKGAAIAYFKLLLSNSSYVPRKPTKNTTEGRRSTSS